MTALEPLALPTDNADSWLATRCDQALERARAAVDALIASPPATPVEVLEAWNDIQIDISNASCAAGLLAQVHPEAGIRDAADGAERRIDAFSTALGLDPNLYRVFSGLDSADLDADAARLLSRVLRDFRRAGVDRPEADRARLEELAAQELAAGQEFGKNIREGVRSITVRPEALEGMPADWLAAHPAGEDGLVTVTTDYPDSIPLITFCSVRETRAAMTWERLNVGWPANDDVLQRLLGLRREHAALLGYADWPDFDAEVKMIGTGAAIAEFIDKIADAAHDRALADKQVVLDRLRQDVPDAQDIEGGDGSYYNELVRKERFEVDAQQVRTYFDFERVQQGLLEVTGRLFGLEWQSVTDAPVWHPDVTAYDVMRDGERIGRIYLDLHPREGKFKHAAQFTLVKGVEGRQLAEGALVCNLGRGLLEHSQVETLFHEFGHLVHTIVGGQGQRWVRFSGVATEWDFVEAPSQMLEEWAWDASVLETFATNADGEAIPADLVTRMRKAGDFGKGFQARTQMFYAAVSYGLHERERPDLTAFVREMQGRYSVFPYVPETHFQCSFGHLDGYGSGYYTYMWSLVIAKDLFTAFDRSNMFDPVVAQRYRDKILAPGGRRDAAELVEDFLGRPYTFDAYAAWLAE